MTSDAAAQAADRVNIASYIPEVARKYPHVRAIVVPGGRLGNGKRSYAHITFAELERESNRFARGLLELGVARGTRVLLMVRPSLEFFPLTFALFKIGAVPVMIDPGMGRQGLLASIEKVEPQAFVAIPPAHAARALFPRAFRSVKISVTVGRRWWWGGPTLEDVRNPDDSPFDLAPTRRDELAAILFTSGSTGPAKGVEYTHGIFDAQTRLIRDEWGIEAGEVDLPAFPLFALFSTALGVTCVIPDMDPSHPAQVDPARVVEAINDHGVTYSFGSPTFWRRVASYCQSSGARMPSLRRVFMAGAPVPPELLRRFASILEGNVFIPYGATEALPVAWNSGSNVLRDTAEATAAGAGTCVGRVLSVNEVRIIRITEEIVREFADTEVLGPNEIGEIVVRGPTSTRAYFGDQPATERSKIHDGANVWHRMGDVGYLDESGRLWFCGRKSHRVETSNGVLFSRVEAIFERHPRVYRAALVGVGPRGAQKPVLVVECESGQRPKSKPELDDFCRELLDLAKSSPLSQSIDTFLTHPGLPVDVRHNAKIKRELLGPWAAGRLGVKA
ncbi:MAG: AMP-binding protein [Deltaproteobacteria bacterium]|nr:AMP-binding protein [Deltaproteobacteria bacterium]